MYATKNSCKLAIISIVFRERVFEYSQPHESTTEILKVRHMTKEDISRSIECEL